MPIYPGPEPTVPPPGVDTPIPFDVTLTTAGVAEDFVTPAGTLKIKAISLVNSGPGSAFIKPNGVATPDGNNSILVQLKDSYSESGIEVSGPFSFIGEAGKKPRIRGVAWAGV